MIWGEILGAAASFLLGKAGNPWLKSPKIATDGDHGAGICTPSLDWVMSCWAVMLVCIFQHHGLLIWVSGWW